MFKRISLLLLVIVVTGCSITQPLRDIHYVADGWVVAAYDKKSNVFVHAKQLKPVTQQMKAEDPQSFTVRYGDTLSKIAQDHYGSIRYTNALAKVNNIDSSYTIYEGQVLTLPSNNPRQSVDLDRWAVRFVNSGKEDVCVKVNFLQMDYNIDIKQGWYHVATFETKYVGYLIQQPWVMANKAFAFDDAKWVVNTMEVVPFNSETGCVFPQQ